MNERRGLRALFVAALVVCLAGLGSLPVVARGARPSPRPAAAPTATTTETPGLEQLVQAAPSAVDLLVGIATFPDGPPPAATVEALGGLGLAVQPMRRLPMAFVVGTLAQLEAAVTGGLAVDIYPNRRLDYYSDESAASTGADTVHELLDVTGEGVGVAIVDSGVDATHPALADRVTHNVKMIGPEYLNITGLTLVDPRTPGAIAIPFDQGLYNNSDIGSGHGTHVAGIVAADGTGDPALLGMAPDADLVAYSTGELLFITTAVAAFDDILLHHEAWDIEVVNNSWGSSFGIFDPSDPINLASRSLYEAGLTVVFAAGNDTEPMTTNPYSVAPWVISAASATTDRLRSEFSSRGIPADNSEVAILERPASPLLAPEQHVHFDGDQLGIYHPDISAPGSDIVSTGTPLGLLVTHNGDGTATASGTSMAAPHVSGLAALLKQARPELTPDEVREVMQVTAAPMADDSEFWASGYGFLDARHAVDYVLDPGYDPDTLAADQAALDAAVQGAREWAVLSSDLWSFDALPVTVAGLDGRVYEVEVGPETQAVQAITAFPSTAVLGVNLFDWELTVKDAAGTPVASSTTSDIAGHSGLFVDLRSLDTPPAFGTWTVEVAGLLGARDTNLLLGRSVTVEFAELQAQEPVVDPAVPVFTPEGSLSLYFAAGPDEVPAGLLPSPEGCRVDQSAVAGTLANAPPDVPCRASLVGYLTSYGPGQAGSAFTSEPLAADVVIGGDASLAVWLADTLQPVYSAALTSRMAVNLEMEDPQGVVTALAAGDVGETQVGPAPTRGTYTLDVAPTTVPAGSRLRLRLQISGVYTATLRMLFGGAFADGGITLTTGSFQ